MSFNYHCFNSACRAECDLCNSSGKIVLGEESHDLVCPHNEEEKLKLMGENVSGCTTGKLTSAQIHKEKKARSHKDFQKHILPSLKKDDRNDFLIKDGKKL